MSRDSRPLARWLVAALCAALPVAAVAQAAAAADAAQDTFPITRFRVLGNTLLPDDAVERLVAASVGPARTLRDIQAAIDRLDAAYHAAGFAATRVTAPAQELTGGIVTLTVSESRLGRVTVQGNAHFSEANVRASLPQLQAGRPPNLRAMSDSVQLANDNPAKQVAISLSPAAADGSVDATIAVDDRDPLRVLLSADNTGTPTTGHWRTGVALQHANLFGLDHVGTLAWTTSPHTPGGARVNLWSLGYRLPLYAFGDSLDLVYGRSDVDVPGASPTLGGVLGFTGKGQVWGAHLNVFFARDGERTNKLVFGLDRRETDSSCTSGGEAVDSSGPTPTIAACAPYVTNPLSVTWFGAQQGASAAADAWLGLSSNLPGGRRYTNLDGVRDHYSYLTPGNRDTRDHFTVLRGGASVTLAVAGDWQLRVAGSGQVAGSPLLAGEQLGLTGAGAVRGFEERAVTIDSGAFVNVEASTPDLLARLGPARRAASLRALVFADGGHGVNGHVVAGSGVPASATVSSLGAGLRAAIGRDFSARLDVARVGDPGGEQAGPVRRGDWHAHAAASYAF